MKLHLGICLCQLGDETILLPLHQLLHKFSFGYLLLHHPNLDVSLGNHWMRQLKIKINENNNKTKYTTIKKIWGLSLFQNRSEVKCNSKILIISSNEKTCSKIKYCYLIHNYKASNYLLKFVKANIREVAKTALIIAYRCIYGFPFVFLYV